jgi:hypothetical protein
MPAPCHRYLQMDIVMESGIYHLRHQVRIHVQSGCSGSERAAPEMHRHKVGEALVSPADKCKQDEAWFSIFKLNVTHCRTLIETAVGGIGA